MSLFNFYCDFETGGLNSQDSAITEIAVIGTDENFKTLFEYEAKIKPFYNQNYLYNQKAMDIHGYTVEHLQEHGKDIKDVASDIKAFVKQYGKGIFCAYNVAFDWSFFLQLCTETKNNPANFVKHYDSFGGKFPALHDVMDSFRLSKGINRRTKLIDALSHYNINLKNAHSALADTRALPQLEKKIYSQTQSTTKEEFYKRPFKIEF